ncbi:MAG TPA: hypothetical protein VNK91_07420 [Burkholderiaceae bacterium]|jgi:hypothetical protein|nr:hypothetical protein [Burkholderiaceae bacterium]
MKLPARTRLLTTLAALCALLASQWTLAAHACPLDAAFGNAVEAAATETAGAAHGCCGGEEDATSTICFKHCADEEQATAQSPAGAAPPPATKSWQPERAAVGAERLPLRSDLAQPQAPPLTILYCVSLT